MECEYRIFADKGKPLTGTRVCIPGPSCPFVLLAKGAETAKLKTAISEAANKFPALKEDFCEWQENENGAWVTSCGHNWGFPNGTPETNNVLYCHNCGGRVKTKPYFGDSQ
jgi:hypothetical protein